MAGADLLVEAFPCPHYGLVVPHAGAETPKFSLLLVLCLPMGKQEHIAVSYSSQPNPSVSTPAAPNRRNPRSRLGTRWLGL